MYSEAYKNSLKMLGINRSLDINYCSITPGVRSFNVDVGIPYVELLNSKFTNVHPVVVYSNLIDEIKISLEKEEEYFTEYTEVASLSFEEFLRLFEIYIYDDYIDNDNKRLLLEGFLFEYNMYNKLIIKINKLITKYNDVILENLEEKDLDLFMVSLSNHLVNTYIEQPSGVCMEFWETAARKPQGDERSLYALLKGKIFEADSVSYVLSNLTRFQHLRGQYMDVVIDVLFEDGVKLLEGKIPELRGKNIAKGI